MTNGHLVHQNTIYINENFIFIINRIYSGIKYIHKITTQHPAA
jgi:hypothetical protein